MIQAARQCRRCAECEHSNHHWIECCETIDEGLETGMLIFDRVCKHCELLGTACDECDGTGGYVPAAVVAGEVVGPDACANCNGEGIVASCLYSET